jgi:arylsulfatase A
LATFAAIVDRDLPPTGAGEDSFNLLPVLLGEQPDDQPIREPLVIQSTASNMTIRSGDWKLITRQGGGAFNPTGEGFMSQNLEPILGEAPGQLYNLLEDPGETTNLYIEHEDVVRTLKKMLKKIKERTVIKEY